MGPAEFQNAHAHVLAILMGEGDSDFIAAISRPLDPRRILYVGLTETTPFETGFIEKHGLAHVSPEELATSADLSSPGCEPRVPSGWRFISMSMCWIPPITTFCCSAAVRRAGCVRRRGQRSFETSFRMRSSHGAAEAPVRVVLTGEEASVRIEVMNRGPALEPSALEQIFDPLKKRHFGTPCYR